MSAEDDIAKAKDLIRVGAEVLAKAGAPVNLAELGLDKSIQLNPANRHRAEDQSKSMFDRMSSAELMELYRTDRPKWQEIMDGVLSAGERKLAELQQRSRPY